jgi:hypothetical protein
MVINLMSGLELQEERLKLLKLVKAIDQELARRTDMGVALEANRMGEVVHINALKGRRSR